jgi:DNA-binding XRE family transcriptional regulator
LISKGNIFIILSVQYNRKAERLIKKKEKEGNKMNNTEVGSRIRAKRKELKINQKALATTLGISQPEMSNIEKGKRTLTDKHVSSVSAALSCDANWLVNGSAAAAPAAPAVATA